MVITDIAIYIIVLLSYNYNGVGVAKYALRRWLHYTCMHCYIYSHRHIFGTVVCGLYREVVAVCKE